MHWLIAVINFQIMDSTSLNKKNSKIFYKRLFIYLVMLLKFGSVFQDWENAVISGIYAFKNWPSLGPQHRLKS